MHLYPSNLDYFFNYTPYYVNLNVVFIQHQNHVAWDCFKGQRPNMQLTPIFSIVYIYTYRNKNIGKKNKSIFFLPCIIKNYKTFWGPLYRSDYASNDCIIQYNWKSLNLMSSIETSTCRVIRCRANFLSSTTKFSKQKIDFNGILCVKVSQKGSSKKRYHRKVIGLILILSIAQRVYKISSGINLFSALLE